MRCLYFIIFTKQVDEFDDIPVWTIFWRAFLKVTYFTWLLKSWHLIWKDKNAICAWKYLHTTLKYEFYVEIRPRPVYALTYTVFAWRRNRKSIMHCSIVFVPKELNYKPFARKQIAMFTIWINLIESLFINGQHKILAAQIFTAIS